MIDQIQAQRMVPFNTSVQMPEIKEQEGIFADVLDSAMGLLNATNEAEQYTTELTYDFMTGKNDNIHNLLIAQEKSSILLQFTMQVRNKALEAYQEIMRISV